MVTKLVMHNFYFYFLIRLRLLTFRSDFLGCFKCTEMHCSFRLVKATHVLLGTVEDNNFGNSADKLRMPKSAAYSAAE